VAGTVPVRVERAASPEGPPPPVARPHLSARARSDLASTAGLLAALLAVVAAISPWWVLSSSGPGTTSTVAFYPGSQVSAYTNGGGGTTTYAGIAAPSVGALYGGVLAGLAVLALLAAATAIHGFASVRGRWSSPRLRRIGRAGLLGAVLLALLLALAAPLAQPPLYQHDNPSNACSSPPPAVACASFWGSMNQGGVSTVWGAGFGWWADAVASGLLAAMLAFEVAVAAPSLPRPPVPAPPTVAPRPPEEERPPRPTTPLSVADLRRLAELKWLSDAGQVAPTAFLEAKQRLLDASPPAGLAGPDPRGPPPSEELSVLRSLHDSGVLTDAEYEVLERRVLLWI
jgi:hypothetical protein